MSRIIYDNKIVLETEDYNYSAGITVLSLIPGYEDCSIKRIIDKTTDDMYGWNEKVAREVRLAIEQHKDAVIQKKLREIAVIARQYNNGNSLIQILVDEENYIATVVRQINSIPRTAQVKRYVFMKEDINSIDTGNGVLFSKRDTNGEEYLFFSKDISLIETDWVPKAITDSIEEIKEDLSYFLLGLHEFLIHPEDGQKYDNVCTEEKIKAFDEIISPMLLFFQEPFFDMEDLCFSRIFFIEDAYYKISALLNLEKRIIKFSCSLWNKSPAVVSTECLFLKENEVCTLEMLEEVKNKLITQIVNKIRDSSIRPIRSSGVFID